MEKEETKDLLIRNVPLKLYLKLEKAAKRHHRSKAKEAISALELGLMYQPRPLEAAPPFRWPEKMSTEFIQDAIDEGRA